MKAVQLQQFGGPEVLQVVDLPDPVPGPGQILIEVEAAAVNWSDTMRRSDTSYPFPTPLPFVPGGEVAGTVAGLGEGVDGPPVGTPVFALVGDDGRGGYAEYAVAQAAFVIPRPDGVSADAAASIMVAGGTAMVMLRGAARLAPGESVLVEGAAGGVGTYAVQIAKAIGAGTVVAAAGTADRRAAAAGLGADLVVDQSSSAWPAMVREVVPPGVDVVLQCSGAPTMAEAFSVLGPFGRMLVYGFASGEPGALSAADQHRLFYQPVLNQSVAGFNIGLWFGLRPDVAVPALVELIGLVASGRVVPRIGAVMSLTEAARAHELLQRREVVGKIVLRPH